MAMVSGKQALTVRRRWPIVAVALLALVSACSGADDAGTNGDAELASATTTETSAPTTSESTVSSDDSGSATDSTPTAGAAADPQGAVDTWIQLLDAAKTGEPTDNETTTIETLSNDRTTNRLLTPLFTPLPGRELTHYPATTELDNGTIAIDDCIVMNQAISIGISNWFTGIATPDPNSPTGWTITDIVLINLEPCVPRSIAQAAIDGYEAYWDARVTFYDPPDRNSPLIDQTTTGGHKDFVLGLIDDFASNGQTLRGRPGTEPGISEFTSPTELTIIDCQDVDPDYGVYVAATGERTDRIAPISDGELDLSQATLRLEGGTWKVSELLGSGDVQCRTPPLPTVLDLAGG
jgi:hypothetical protein